MQVLEEIKNEWKLLKERNDTTFLANKLGMAPQNVSTIFRTGKGSISKIAFIKKFYDERKKKVKFINKINQDQD